VDVGRTARAAGGLALGALAAQYVPSALALGQWSALTRVPGDLCRWRGPADRPAVALTFDDGPDPEGTPAVLDQLDAVGLRATFFCLGERAERFDDLVDEIGRRGHQVEVHGYRHEHHLARTPSWVGRDLAAAGRAMAGCGVRPRWYRPTYGQLTGATLLAARRQGWQLVLWSAWGREWTTTDPADVLSTVSRGLRPGAIVLLHDSDRFGVPGMARVARGALAPLAEELARRGLTAVTLDQLVASTGR